VFFSFVLVGITILQFWFWWRCVWCILHAWHIASTKKVYSGAATTLEVSYQRPETNAATTALNLNAPNLGAPSRHPFAKWVNSVHLNAVPFRS
jgi:hypothetical protein